MNKITEIIKIADIHATRMRYAITKLGNFFPISELKMSNISEQDFLLLELLVNRFSKLQDFIGAKLIDAFLESKGELINNMTMIDKINKLEKLNIIDNANLWFKMREIRNHLAHEYPDHPEITAKYLNQVFNLAPELLSWFENIKDK
jgi:hypothetical protein